MVHGLGEHVIEQFPRSQVDFVVANQMTTGTDSNSDGIDLRIQ